jgi:hypothetical protein
VASGIDRQRLTIALAAPPVYRRTSGVSVDVIDQLLD